MDKPGLFLTSDPQLDLLKQLEQLEPQYLAANAPDLDVRDKLRVFLKDSLTFARNHYGLSRELVVDRMNQCLPKEQRITKRQLDGWLATSAEDRPFPLDMLAAFIWATRGQLGPLTVVTEVLGLHLVDTQEMLAAKLGETAMEKSRLAQVERMLRQRLRG